VPFLLLPKVTIDELSMALSADRRGKQCRHENILLATKNAYFGTANTKTNCFTKPVK
jgi:hypothetical protein